MSDFKGKISGFHVLRFGVGADVRLRCFAMGPNHCHRLTERKFK